MERSTSSLLLLLSVMYFAVKSKYAMNFIEDSCSVTPYPALCVQTLSFYAAMIQQSPFRLAETAFSVGLVESQSTKAFMSEVTKFRGLKPREFDAIKNCTDDLGDNIDSLSKSVQEMKQMGDAIAKEQEFQSHISNLLTWLSAALIDVNTCLNGFSSGALEGLIKSLGKTQAINSAQVISNMLALVNWLASKN